MSAKLTLTTIDGQLLANVTVPTCLPDVTLAQWIAFVAPNSPEADSVMTGLAPEVLATLQEAGRAQLLENLLFLTDAPVLRELLPTPGLYEVGHCAFGLYGQALAYFEAHPELTRLAQGAYLHALYSAPTSSKMPPEQLALTHAAVLAAPVTEVYADCQFFLASWERYQNGTTLPGPSQPGLLRFAVATPAPPAGWLGKLGLSSLLRPLNSGKRAVA
jgi:hypothetical protein